METGDGDDHRQAKGAYHADEVLQVGQALFNSRQVWRFQVSCANSAMGPEGTDGRDKDGRTGLQVIEAGLDVHELLKAQVRAESRLGQDVVGVTEGQTVGQDRAAAVGYVSEGSGVDHHGLPLCSLHQVRLYGVP